VKGSEHLAGFEEPGCEVRAVIQGLEYLLAFRARKGLMAFLGIVDGMENAMRAKTQFPGLVVIDPQSIDFLAASWAIRHIITTFDLYLPFRYRENDLQYVLFGRFRVIVFLN
jgi:hypothetical protein